MGMRLMVARRYYNTHEVHRQLTHYMHKSDPNLDRDFFVRQVEHQFKLFYNSRRKEDFVSFCEWRLAIQLLKEKAPEFQAWARDQVEEQIAQGATKRPERVQQWREAVNWKYAIFWQQFTNPEDLTIKRNT